jgi:hypothetical protein
MLTFENRVLETLRSYAQQTDDTPEDVSFAYSEGAVVVQAWTRYRVWTGNSDDGWLTGYLRDPGAGKFCCVMHVGVG